MRRVILATLLLAAGEFSAADEKKGAPAKAAEAWNGTYGVFMASRDGKRDPILDEVTAAVIKDGMLTLQRPKGKDEVLNFTLDPTKSPGHIDFGALPGVYETEQLGGKPVIRIAYRIDGGERPKSIRDNGTGVRVIALVLKEK